MYKDIDKEELTLMGLFSTSWEIYKKCFKHIFLIILLYLPLYIVMDYLGINFNSFRTRNSPLNIITIISGIITVFINVGIIFIVKERLIDFHNEDINIGYILKESLSKWWDVLITELLSGLIIIGMTLLLIVPGIIWSIYYIFSLQVVVIKDLRGKEALDFSKEMVSGRWWKVFGTIFLFNLILGGISFCLFKFQTYYFGQLSIITEIIVDIIGAISTVLITIFFMNLDFNDHNSAEYKLEEYIEIDEESI
ncbi:hypothetical protein KQI42_13230 [Tissierella sp. MSJ-40]|uniref:Glycerophosphoryl diester phosphodiesterase membrane domain-containing protein n=1 Tax=Tissierella simiarum TaxID=2841534 RepID=A0ABS6E9U7_9FIRM|nr:hypothetical protein [Tissierella simiarum]MBU5438984.1 hypothetical protein [Tissierella simiarum]